MNKKRILFVVVDFFKGGAERFAYEVDKALNKEQFNVTIFCLGQENENNKEWNRFYDKEHQKLGTKIIYSDSFRRKTSSSKTVKLLKRTLKLKSKYYLKKEKIIDFYNQFDLIHFMGEYTVFDFLPIEILQKSAVYSMSAKFQNPKLYEKFNFDYPYNFISTFHDNEIPIEYSEFKKIHHWHFPLVFEMIYKKVQWSFSERNIKKIGIFTRLDKYKPLDPFIYSFQLLLDKFPNAELHIFGNGDPEKEGINAYVNRLELADKIFFRGHQEEMVKTALKEQIDLSWFQGYNNSRPAGYAGLDICSVGIPLLCWDFYEKPITDKNLIFPHFKNLNDFVNTSIKVLTDKKFANQLSENQFNEVLNKRNSAKKINDLENIYTEIINKTKS